LYTNFWSRVVSLILAHKGSYERATENYELALAVFREVGDRRREGILLHNTGLSLEKLGRRKEAVEKAKAALQILKPLEDPHLDAIREFLFSLGHVVFD
jgi:tetratricopeptide (TPR) repeat protein